MLPKKLCVDFKFVCGSTYLFGFINVLVIYKYFAFTILLLLQFNIPYGYFKFLRVGVVKIDDLTTR